MLYVHVCTVYIVANPCVQYLSIEIKEAMRAVDVVERSEAGHRAIDVHRVDVHPSPATQEDPVRVGPTHEYLPETKAH